MCVSISDALARVQPAAASDTSIELGVRKPRMIQAWLGSQMSLSSWQEKPSPTEVQSTSVAKSLVE